MATFNKKSLIIIAAKDISQNRRIPTLATFFAKRGYEVHVYAFTLPNPKLNDPTVRFHVPTTVTAADRILNWLIETESRTQDMFRPRFSGSKLLGFLIGSIEFLKLRLRAPLTWLALAIYGHHVSTADVDRYRQERKYAELLRAVFNSPVADRRRQKFHMNVQKQIQDKIHKNTVLLCHDRFSAELVSSFSEKCKTTIFDVVELIQHRSRTSLETKSRYQLQEIKSAESLLKSSILLTVSDAISSQLNIKTPILSFLNGRSRTEHVERSKEKKIIAFSGSFFPGCGLNRLLKTLHHMPPEYELLLVGAFSSESYKSEILESIRSHKIETRVDVVEGIEFNAIPTHLSQACLYVLPFHPEKLNLKVSMPNRLFDALSAGLPIVSQEGLYLTEWVAARGIGLATDFSFPEQAALQITEALREGESNALGEKVSETFEETSSENQILRLERFLKENIKSF